MTAVDGGNVAISQEVTWTAKFVDRISEVTDSMNVGGTQFLLTICASYSTAVAGSLQIKCDAIGGGGGASAQFVDTNKFKESDINYFIQVRVTNQRLAPPDLTEFSPIEGLPASEFTRVYGDSFISGFTEGGEFYALVSIKLRDRENAKQIRGELEVELNFTAISVEGSAHLDKSEGSKKIDGETTITVAWRGGGDIKDATVVDWTLDTLKKVAMEFPEHVMACPMRTKYALLSRRPAFPLIDKRHSAILTKYTSLKGFYEKTIKGTPLGTIPLSTSIFARS